MESAGRPMSGHLRCYLKILYLLFLLQRTLSQETQSDEFDDELYHVINSVRDSSLWTYPTQARSRVARSVSFSNSSENSLWSDLWDECGKRTNFACIKTGMFKYLDKSLEVRDDVRVSESLLFRRNSNKYNGVCDNSEEERERCSKYYMERLNLKEESIENNGIPKTEGSSESTLHETEPVHSDDIPDVEEDLLEENTRDLHGMADVSDILYDKGSQFLMTHDFEVELPHMFFGGGSIRIEPKSFVEDSEDEEGGAMVKILFKPPPSESSIGSGRLLFHHIKKLFKKKLMHSFMALVLIIKMIKVKLMFLLPMVVGQTTAKRLLLKVLLFLIPGLAHLFKLCHYYHLEHAKYHHHHHKIKHHHHHHQIPVPVPVPVPVHHHDTHPQVEHHVHEEQGYGPYAPHGNHISGPPSLTPHDEYDYPPLGNGPNHHRNENPYTSSVNQFNDNEAAMTSWGLGSSSNYAETGVLDAKDQPTYFSDEKSVYKKSPSLNNYSPALVNEFMAIQKQYGGGNLQALTPRPPPGAATVPVVYDPFYSPILQKIDNIFVQLGFNEEACRERLVCSMYKNPQRFSPHSNLLSAELSRDSNELQRPMLHNSAVVRFYKYVQAARDGQDQKDCLRIYNYCTVSTEKR